MIYASVMEKLPPLEKLRACCDECRQLDIGEALSELRVNLQKVPELVHSVKCNAVDFGIILGGLVSTLVTKHLVDFPRHRITVYWAA